MPAPINPPLDPTFCEPSRPRRWIPVSLRMFVGLVAILGVMSSSVGVTTYRKYLAIREIERLGGSVHLSPRNSERPGPRFGDDLTSAFGDMHTVYFGKSSGLTDAHLPDIS